VGAQRVKVLSGSLCKGDDMLFNIVSTLVRFFTF
jgi:hypothetical protein